MLKYLLLIIAIQYSIVSSAQKWDYQWLFGYNAGKDERFGITKLDFNNKKVDVSYYREAEHYNLGYTGSIIDDMYGNIMLLTNNCDVRDAYWNIISGDSLITPTSLGTQGCSGDYALRYSAMQSAIFLPDILDNTIIYLVTKDLDIDFDAQDVYSNNMYFYSIKKDNGQFEFNRMYRDSSKEIVGRLLTACPNRKKDKWWILMPKNHSNTFKKYLVGDNVIETMDTQSIGMIINELELGIGQAQFSPDGSMLGINSEQHGVLLYDFDNETGDLSNFRAIPYPNSEDVAAGLCFSPNSRFIYLTTAEDVYQIDLEEDNEIYHVGNYFSFDGDNWPVGLGMIFSGPDCRLYVSPGSTTYYLHVILNPDAKGVDCNFVERAIELPTNLPHDLPNLPQYRYLTGCDTSIVFPREELVLVEQALSSSSQFTIYPNPARDYIKVVLTKMDRWSKWQIVDISGSVVDSGTYSDMQKIDISNLHKGMYILKMKDKKGYVSVGKFVVE